MQKLSQAMIEDQDGSTTCFLIVEGADFKLVPVRDDGFSGNPVGTNTTD